MWRVMEVVNWGRGERERRENEEAERVREERVGREERGGRYRVRERWRGGEEEEGGTCIFARVSLGIKKEVRSWRKGDKLT